jgi:hypothetical protein
MSFIKSKQRVADHGEVFTPAWMTQRKNVLSPQAALLCGHRAQGRQSQPMGIVEYKLFETLPVELQTSLPSIEQIERELAGDDTQSDEIKS